MIRSSQGLPPKTRKQYLVLHAAATPKTPSRPTVPLARRHGPNLPSASCVSSALARQLHGRHSRCILRCRVVDRVVGHAAMANLVFAVLHVLVPGINWVRADALESRADVLVRPVPLLACLALAGVTEALVHVRRRRARQRVRGRRGRLHAVVVCLAGDLARRLRPERLVRRRRAGGERLRVELGQAVAADLDAGCVLCGWRVGQLDNTA